MQVAELHPRLRIPARLISSVDASVVVCDEFPAFLSRVREHTGLQSRVIKLQNVRIKVACGIPVQRLVHMPLETQIATLPVPLCIKIHRIYCLLCGNVYCMLCETHLDNRIELNHGVLCDASHCTTRVLYKCLPLTGATDE